MAETLDSWFWGAVCLAGVVALLIGLRWWQHVPFEKTQPQIWKS